MKKLLLLSSIAILLSSCADNKGESVNANLDIIPELGHKKVYT